MKVIIDSDEWYPVYSVVRVTPDTNDNPFNEVVEMSEEDVERFEKAEQDFRAIQQELRKK